MIFERISDVIPPKMKILNMVVPILMHYQHFPLKKTVKMYFVADNSTKRYSNILRHELIYLILMCVFFSFRYPYTQ